MTSQLLWSVRRELWENRYLLVAPLLVTAVVLFGSSASLISAASKRGSVLIPMRMAPAPIMLATLIVGFFYSLDALYGERRDRSILFWKSLPVSDRTTVLAKAGIPLVVLPLIAYSLSVATQLVLLLLSAPVLVANHRSVTAAWDQFSFGQGLIVMFYGLTVHALWFAPIYAWFLLVSAWAKRAPFLWAFLPLFAIAALERLMFNTSFFMAGLGYRAVGAMSRAFVRVSEHQGFSLSDLTPLRFLGTPGLWLGLVFAAGCVAAAIRLRRHREPI